MLINIAFIKTNLRQGCNYAYKILFFWLRKYLTFQACYVNKSKPAIFFPKPQYMRNIKVFNGVKHKWKLFVISAFCVNLCVWIKCLKTFLLFFLMYPLFMLPHVFFWNDFHYMTSLFMHGNNKIWFKRRQNAAVVFKKF